MNKASELDEEVLLFITCHFRKISVRSKGSYESPWDQLRSSNSARAPKGLFEQSRRLKSRDKEILQYDSTMGSTASYNTTSYKYSIKFSHRSVTGVSISEFLNP